MIGKSLEVSNFNQLFLKLNQFIYNKLRHSSNSKLKDPHEPSICKNLELKCKPQQEWTR